MKKKLLISLLCLSGAVSVFANNTNMSQAVPLTGDQMASAILWKSLGQNTDNFRHSMNANLKNYAFAYTPKLYEDSNGNEIRIKRESNKIEGVFAEQVRPMMQKNQLFTVQKTINIGNYDFNHHRFSFNLPKSFYLKADGGLEALMKKLNVRYNNAFKVTDTNTRKKSYIPAHIAMSESKADQFISAHPDRKVCAVYTVKDVHVTDPDRKNIINQKYTVTGQFVSFSYQPGICHS